MGKWKRLSFLVHMIHIHFKYISRYFFGNPYFSDITPLCTFFYKNFFYKNHMAQKY